jgi:hypothetical protein
MLFRQLCQCAYHHLVFDIEHDSEQLYFLGIAGAKASSSSMTQHSPSNGLIDRIEFETVLSALLSSLAFYSELACHGALRRSRQEGVIFSANLYLAAHRNPSSESWE